MTVNGNGDRALLVSLRFAYYSLGIQAVISVLVLILSFWLIIQPTEPTANSVAYNLITFVVGVWLGRGIDYSMTRFKDR